MGHARVVRVFVALALVIPASLAAAAAGPAGAASGATCSVFNVSVKGAGTLSGCTDKTNTGGSAKFVATVTKSPYTAKITWKGTGTTTSSLKYSEPAKSICPKGTTEIVVSGSVTGGTGSALKSIPKKSAVLADECYNAKAKPAMALTLAPKTLFHI